MYIIEAEFFDECNELFLGPYFMQNFLLLWRQGFFMASGNRTLCAVLRGFFPFFLRQNKIKRKSTYLCSSCKPPHAGFAEFSSGSVRGRFQFYRPFWWWLPLASRPTRYSEFLRQCTIQGLSLPEKSHQL